MLEVKESLVCLFAASNGVMYIVGAHRMLNDLVHFERDLLCEASYCRLYLRNKHFLTLSLYDFSL